MEGQGGEGGLGPPTFLAGGPPLFCRKLRNNTVKINKYRNVLSHCTKGVAMAGPPHFKLGSSIYEESGRKWDIFNIIETYSSLLFV